MPIAESNTFSVVIQPNVPAWFAALSSGQAAQVGSNSIASLSTIGQTRLLTDVWIGNAVSQTRKELINAAPGGHNVSADNSVYVMRLNQTTPAWVRTRDGTGDQNGVSDTENGAGYTSTGQPSHTHSYHRPVATGTHFWYPGLDSVVGSNGFWTTSTFSYDLSQNSGGVFRRHGRGRTSGSINKWLGGSAAWDPVTDRIFSGPQWGADGLAFYFNATTVLAAADVVFPGAVPGVQTMSWPGSTDYSVMLCADDLRLLILISVFGLYTANPDNPAAGWTARTLGAGNDYSDGVGYVYHRGARKLYRYSGGGTTIRVVDIPTNLASTWTGRNATYTGAVCPAPSALPGDSSGIYSRFNIIHDMGDGNACLVASPDENYTGVWVCKVPSGGF